MRPIFMAAVLCSSAWGLGCGSDPETPQGELGEACRAGATCDGALECKADICVQPDAPSGGLGEACHPDDTCDDALVCESGICVEPVEPTGGLGEACHPDDTCDDALVCESDVCVEPDDEAIDYDDYAVRSVGPAGGYVFYENPNWETDGWRFLEAAPASTEKTDIVWGGSGTFVGTVEIAGRALDDPEKWVAGTGMENTRRILEAYGDAEPFEGRSDYAARVADQLVVEHDGRVFDDWFLPSPDGLAYIYVNLHDTTNGQTKLGGFLNTQYWSSSEVESRDDLARAFSMSSGQWNNQPTKDETRFVRAVRAF